MLQRNSRHPFLKLFDGADPRANTAKRMTTTTPAQAMFMMNNEFMHQQSEKFAARLLRSRSKPTQRVELAYQLAFGRSADPDETRQVMSYLDRYTHKLAETGVPAGRQRASAWASFARVLFSSNEFVYVD